MTTREEQKMFLGERIMNMDNLTPQQLAEQKLPKKNVYKNEKVEYGEQNSLNGCQILKGLLNLLVVVNIIFWYTFIGMTENRFFSELIPLIVFHVIFSFCSFCSMESSQYLENIKTFDQIREYENKIKETNVVMQCHSNATHTERRGSGKSQRTVTITTFSKNENFSYTECIDNSQELFKKVIENSHIVKVKTILKIYYGDKYTEDCYNILKDGVTQEAWGKDRNTRGWQTQVIAGTQNNLLACSDDIPLYITRGWQFIFYFLGLMLLWEYLFCKVTDSFIWYLQKNIKIDKRKDNEAYNMIWKEQKLKQLGINPLQNEQLLQNNNNNSQIQIELPNKKQNENKLKHNINENDAFQSDVIQTNKILEQKQQIQVKVNSNQIENQDKKEEEVEQRLNITQEIKDNTNKEDEKQKQMQQSV